MEYKYANIAILSGKGGTGKTTISTNLALAMRANYVDCDVEEPNGFLFIEPKIHRTQEVLMDYPVIDMEKCTLCSSCVSVCQFNALAKTDREIMLFDKLCHGCGACKIVCAYDALSYNKRKIGIIEKGIGHGIGCSRGVLDIGEPMAVPILNKLLKDCDSGINIIDCPPGTSCNVVTTLRYANLAILVTEPTQFGLHDLVRAAELTKILKIPASVIINKAGGDDDIIRNYCAWNEIAIIGSIPYSQNIALAYSKGDMLYATLKGKDMFNKLAAKVEEALKWI